MAKMIETILPKYLARLDGAEKLEGGKHVPIRVGDMIVNYIIEDSINKIEARKWSGLDGDLRNDNLKELLHRSDFITERQAAARWFGEVGEIFVALVLIDGEWNISFFKPISYEMIKTNVIEMTAESGLTYKISGASYDLFYRWRTASERETNPKTGEDISGRIIRETYYTNSTTEEVTETFIFPRDVKFVPGKMIRNNAESLPDWVRIASILFEINKLSEDIPIEWENIKTMWSSVGVFGGGKNAENIQKLINSGQRYKQDNSVNAKFESQYQLLMSGSTSLTTLIQAIVFLEDRAMKYAFQGRDTDSSGTNKHGLQVGLFNQAHSEYLSRKMRQRENDFTRFFKDVVAPITGIEVPNKITIQASEYEKGKKDAMLNIDAQRQYNLAQAEAQKANAQKSIVSSEKITQEKNKIIQEKNKIVQETKEIKNGANQNQNQNQNQNNPNDPSANKNVQNNIDN